MRFLLSFFVVMMVALPAHALKVTNLDSIAWPVVLHDAGTTRQVTLKPGQSMYTPGYAIRLNLPGKPEQLSHRNDEYVIWPHGRLLIQHYGHANHHAL